ncbi:MAG: hypothetical protein OEV36_05585 [Myxococcales bacterium]|nr:hypothetical protein [Myxococcales bacterium]
MLGLLGAHYPLPLVDGEDFLPELARRTLAPFVYVLFVGAWFWRPTRSEPRGSP